MTSPAANETVEAPAAPDEAPAPAKGLMFQLNDIFDHTNKDSGDYNICMSGRSDNGQAVSLTVRGYRPWLRVLYKVPAHEKGKKTASDIHSALKTTFNTHFLINGKNSDGEPFYPHDDIKVEVTAESLRSIMCYDPYTTQYCFKVSVASIDLKRMVNTILTSKKPSMVKSRKVNSDHITICDNTLEACIDFCHDTGIRPSGWVRVQKDASLLKKTIGMEATLDEVSAVPERHDMAPYVIASYDIEVDGTREAFPTPDRAMCKITMIATVLQRYGETTPYLKHCVVLGDTLPPENNPDAFTDVQLVCVKSEKELIIEWVRVMREEAPDVVTGYNILGFDGEFIYERAKRYQIEEMNLSRFDAIPSKYEQRKLESSALGANLFKYFTIPGAVIIDMLSVVKRSQKLTSYKLDDVAFEFLGDKKHDVKFWHIFAWYHESQQKRGEVAAYCVQDAALPLRLLLKLNVLPESVQMSNVTCVPIRYLEQRGQQIKCFSQIAEFANKRGFTVPKDPELVAQNATYKGAIVLEPEVGCHRGFVSCLDFKSLYPSIMMANNLSYESFISTDMWQRMQESGKLELVDTAEMEGVEGTVFKTYTFCEKRVIKEFKCFDDDVYYRFCQNTEGLLPAILTELMAARKAAKKDMKNTKDPFMKSVFDGKQLAIKVSCNSVYGFCAAQMIPNVDIAACVTSIGRSMILLTKHQLEKHYTCKVVYGDTDSNYVSFYAPDDWTGTDENWNWHISPIAAEHVTKEIDHYLYHKGINELEHECTKSPMILYSKKRYLGLSKESLDGPAKISMMGLQAVRRDACDLLKEMSGQVIDMLVKQDFNVDAIVKYVKETITQLFNHEIPLEKLVLSKSLSRSKKCENMRDARNGSKGGLVQCCDPQLWSVKKGQMRATKTKDADPDAIDMNVCQTCMEQCYPASAGYTVDRTTVRKQPHVYLAEVLQSRDGAEAPGTGSRVPYILVERSDATMQYERAEDPEYVRDNGLRYDSMYYLNTQLLNPIFDLLEPMLDAKEHIFREWLDLASKAHQDDLDRRKAARKAISDAAKAIRDQAKAEEMAKRKLERETERAKVRAEKEQLKAAEKLEKERLKIQAKALKLATNGKPRQAKPKAAPAAAPAAAPVADVEAPASVQ